MSQPFDISLLMRLKRLYEKNKPLFAQFHSNVMLDCFKVDWTISPISNDGKSFEAEFAGIKLKVMFVTIAPDGPPAIEFWDVDRVDQSKPKLLGRVGFLSTQGTTAVKRKAQYGGEEDLSITESDDAALLLAQHFWMAWPKENVSGLFS